MIDPTMMLANQLSAYSNVALGMLQAQNPYANSLAQYQSQLASAQLLSGLSNNFRSGAEPSRTGVWERGRAIAYANDGDRLIERLAFWSALALVPFFGLIASRVSNRMAEELDRVTDEVERWLEMAASYQNDGTNV